MFAIGGMAVTALVALVMNGPDEPAKTDADRLQGAWTMGSLTVNGDRVEGDAVESAKLVIEGDKYKVNFGERMVSSTFTLDAGKTPRTIDFRYLDGPQEGEKIKGVYSLDGDTFTMCRPLRAEDDRPKALASPADSALILVVWKRAKPATKEEQARTAAIEAELKRFEGTWMFASIEIEGKARDGATFEEEGLVLKGNRFTAIGPKAQDAGGTFRIDPTATPKTLDVTFDDGPAKGRTYRCVYELTNDTYTACIPQDGEPRPTSLDSTPGSGRIREVLKRRKP